MTRLVFPADKVIDKFIAGEVAHTASDNVPSGRRVWSTTTGATDGRLRLQSYATAVAERSPDGSTILVTELKYSPTTSHLLSRLRGSLRAAGYVEDGFDIISQTRVPGRWGGFGIPWAPSWYQDAPAVKWVKEVDRG